MALDIGTADWVWLPEYDDSRNPGSIVLFRREFDLDENGCAALSIDVSADSRYRLFLNGHSISIGPCKGTPLRWYYETVDAAPFLRPGRNVLAAQVLRYSPGHRGNTSVTRTPLPGFYLRGRGSKSNLSIGTNETWRCIEDVATTLSGQSDLDFFLSVYETVQGSARRFGWEHVGFDDSHWSFARIHINDSPMPEASILPWNLCPREIPPLTEIPKRFKSVVQVRKPTIQDASTPAGLAWSELLTASKPLFVPPHTEVEVDVEAPEYSTGFLQFSFSRGAKAVVRHLSAESYEEVPRDAEVTRRKGDRRDYKNGYLNGYYDSYTIAGRDVETYEPFWFRAFRFLRVHIVTVNEGLIIADLSYREHNYPLDVAGRLESCSNPLFRQFWDVSLRTLKNCMHETYEDCPYYEQSQYAFDTRTEMLLTYLVSNDDGLARKAVDDFHCSIRPNGLIALRFPAHTNFFLPGFSLFFPLILHDHVLYKGDYAFTKRYLPTVDAILDHFDRTLTADGLVGQFDRRYWSYVDWVDGWDVGVPPAARVGPATYFSLIYALGLQAASGVARYAGRDSQAEEYLQRGKAVLGAVNKHCFSDGLYWDGPVRDIPQNEPSTWLSQHCQFYAVLAGAVTGSAARELMIKALDSDRLRPVSSSQAFYLFRALEATDLYDRTPSCWGPWEKMLAQNLDTWAECLDAPRSDCHAWSAIPLYEIPSVIVGVRPTSPGFASATIRPRMDLLKEVDCSIASPRGPIRVRWAPVEADGGTGGEPNIHISVDAPPGIRFQLVLCEPACEKHQIVLFEGQYEVKLRARVASR